MNKKELDEYCLSLGLVRQPNLGTLWYGYTYPYKYARPNNVLVGFKVSFKEAQGMALNETAQRTIKVANKVDISTEYNAIACFGFYAIDDSDEEIKNKIYKLVKRYEKVIGYYKKYQVKTKINEIESDFENGGINGNN
jgi:hypothetical protein